MHIPRTPHLTSRGFALNSNRAHLTGGLADSIWNIRSAHGHILAEAPPREGRQRPIDLGDFDRQYGRPEFAQSRSFAWWSNFKTRIFEGKGEIYLGAIILLTIMALTLVVDDPASRPGMITLVAPTFLELLISALGDPLEIRRHFFLFHALEDLLFLGTVTLVARRVEMFLGNGV